jgi:hypothetical protein
MAVAGNHASKPHTYVTQEVWEPASMARRSAAWLIDLGLLLIVVVILATLIGLKASSQNTLVADDGSTTIFSHIPTLWSELLMAAASAAYVIPFWRVNRATLGQRWLNLRVVDVERQAALSWRRSAIRWLLLFGWTIPGAASSISALSWIFALLFVAWFIVLIVSTRRDVPGRGIHDRYAHSIVERRQVYKVLARTTAGSGAALPGVVAAAENHTPRGTGSMTVTPNHAPTAANPGPRRSTRGRPARD